MAKCFDGIRRLDFGKDPKSIDIFGMVSPEGEYVGLGKKLKARGNVEQWLTSVEQSMQVSLKRLAKKAYQDYPESKRTEWIFAQPAQVWSHTLALAHQRGPSLAPHCAGAAFVYNRGTPDVPRDDMGQVRSDACPAVGCPAAASPVSMVVPSS